MIIIAREWQRLLQGTTGTLLRTTKKSSKLAKGISECVIALARAWLVCCLSVVEPFLLLFVGRFVGPHKQVGSDANDMQSTHGGYISDRQWELHSQLHGKNHQEVCLQILDEATRLVEAGLADDDTATQQAVYDTTEAALKSLDMGSTVAACVARRFLDTLRGRGGLLSMEQTENLQMAHDASLATAQALDSLMSSAMQKFYMEQPGVRAEACGDATGPDVDGMLEAEYAAMHEEEGY